jgi:ATP-dependent exoDNAse (exonuclease V) beta subunit
VGQDSTGVDTAVFIDSGSVEETDEWTASNVAGGATRGTILHKLMEEVLTGETADDDAALVTRAGELLTQLGIEPAADRSQGISPTELAETVLRALALPEVAILRPRLVPEYTVFAAEGTNGSERLIFGIADALALDRDRKIDTVIDWKSDTRPGTDTLEHYRGQVQAYMESTGASRGMLIFMTGGSVLAA